MACILLSSSAVRVHNSQAYRKKDVTRERISRILELKDTFLSIQTGFSLANAAVVCDILKCISGLEPSSVITEPRYFEDCDCLKLQLLRFEASVANSNGMVMFPVHQVWPKPSFKAQWKGEEGKADRRRVGKTTLGNGQAWSSASPRGQLRPGNMGKTGRKIICGVPTTLAVKWLMMLMMMIKNVEVNVMINNM